MPKKTATLTLTIFLIAASILAACQIAPIRMAERKVPVPLPLEKRTGPIQLKKILIRIPIGDQIGQIYYGWGCAAGAKTTWNGGRLALTDEELTHAFKTELEKHKYTVAGDSESVFERENVSNAEYLVGGSINKVEANLCFPFTGNPTATIGNPAQVKGGVYVKMTWELYSQAERRVIFRTTTEGSDETKELVTGGSAAILLKAFKENVTGLLADPEFQKRVLNN
jgi:hypothetical protein